MARKAEADGLVLDWSCLPEPTKLDVKAPIHDSCSGWFVADRFRRTRRQIADTPCHVGLTESLYAPKDAHGADLLTIGQAIHRSAVQRHGGEARSCSDDANGACSMVDYSPVNLDVLFDAAGKYVGRIPLVD